MSDLIDEIEQGMMEFLRNVNRDPAAREKVLRALADELQRYAGVCRVEANKLIPSLNVSDPNDQLHVKPWLDTSEWGKWERQ